MGRVTLIFLTALAWAQSAAAQAPQNTNQRDLTLDKPKPTDVKPAPVVVPRSYALVVGISKYKNLPPEGQLDFPSRDAESMYTVLISAEGGQFPAQNVHKLIGPQATLANLRNELEQWLPSVAKDDDRVLIYFAGHGFVSNGKAYLAPYDIDRANIAGSAYSMETLGSVFGGKIRGKWKVLLTDACHSGAITPEADRAQVSRSLLDLNKSLFSLTASRDREQSFESAQWGGGHGIFTYYVIKGMEGEADTNGDGQVTADELAEYVHTNVRNDTKERQNPTSERGSFDPNMLLAYNPGRETAGQKPAAKFGTLVIETNMDGVEVFVDSVSQGVVNKAAPLRLPGIAPGQHTIQGVHLGYEPDGPRQENVYPGQETTVSLKITIARRKNRAATDHFDKGLSDYNKGSKENYQKAANEFKQALTIDPTYSQAALYLARTYNSLFDQANADKYFRLAIQIDPDYTEAHASYGGMLMDRGDLDEAVRQLNTAVQREKDNGTAWYLLAVALARKEAYDQSVQAAREAIRIEPNRAEAHFWLAESLRILKNWKESESEYNRYLELSDFDSKLAGKLNYYILGSLIGFGKKKRAAQTDVWREMRSEANFGLCDSISHQKRLDEAISHCQQALAYDPTDPFAHYLLGRTFSEKFNQAHEIGLLAAARTHFDQVVALNPDTNEAANSRKYIKNIDDVLAQVR
jgi:tetratricopeptide (TPR) repeat protein